MWTDQTGLARVTDRTDRVREIDPEGRGTARALLTGPTVRETGLAGPAVVQGSSTDLTVPAIVQVARAATDRDSTTAGPATM